MRRSLSFAALLVLVMQACTSSAERHVIDMTGFQFQPNALNASTGDTIVFVNHDVVVHTATSSGSGWDSGPIASDSSWTVVMREPGHVRYLCTLHPTMTGTIDVR